MGATRKKQRGGAVIINAQKQKEEMGDFCKAGYTLTVEDYVFEYDDAMLDDLKTNPKFKAMLEELSEELAVDIKVRISESNLCTPDHWKEDVANDKPLIVILISCKSYENVLLNNFGKRPDTKSRDYSFITKPPKGTVYEGGVFNNVYYFGFSHYLHAHDGEIYSCKAEHPEKKIPVQICNLFDGATREACCEAKKKHFASIFARTLSQRQCSKLTQEFLRSKFTELKEKIARIEASKTKMETLTKELTKGKFFLLDSDGSGQLCKPTAANANPCGITNTYTKGLEKSEEFNKRFYTMKRTLKSMKGRVRNRWREEELAKKKKERNELTAFLNSGGDINRVIDGQTALETAVWREEEDTVQFLLERGAKIPKKLIMALLSLPFPMKTTYKTVMFAFFEKYPDMINSPIRGITPLATAVGNKDGGLFFFLLEKGADPTLTSSNDRFNGMQPLHIAASIGLDDAIEPLLKAGADIDAESVSYQTPLMYACKGGYTYTADLLKSLGAKGDCSNVA